jgi:hypothetical protein
LGYWNKTTIDRFEVKERAERYDNDEYDADNKQQDVMSLLAKSRSLIWLPIPFGVLLSKFCECVNSPPLIIVDYKRAGLELYHGWCKRFLMWIVSMARYVLLVGVVFFGGEVSCLGSILCTMIYVLMDIAIPNEKEAPGTQAKQIELQKKEAAIRASNAVAPPQQLTGVHATMDTAHLSPSDRYAVHQEHQRRSTAATPSTTAHHQSSNSNHVHFAVVVSGDTTPSDTNHGRTPSASPAGHDNHSRTPSATPIHHASTPSAHHVHTPSSGHPRSPSTGATDDGHTRTPSQPVLLSPPNQHNRSSSGGTASPAASGHNFPMPVHVVDPAHLSPEQRASIGAQAYTAPSPHLAVPSGHHHGSSSSGSIHLQAPPMMAPTPIGHSSPSSHGSVGHAFDPSPNNGRHSQGGDVVPSPHAASPVHQLDPLHMPH